MRRITVWLTGLTIVVVLVAANRNMCACGGSHVHRSVCQHNLCTELATAFSNNKMTGAQELDDCLAKHPGYLASAEAQPPAGAWIFIALFPQRQECLVVRTDTKDRSGTLVRPDAPGIPCDSEECDRLISSEPHITRWISGG